MHPTPAADLIRRGDESSDDRRRPFERVARADGVCYKVFDDDVCGVRIAKHYLKNRDLEKLGQAVSKVRELRNDVAHNEPTPELMDDARRRMTEAGLWSSDHRFLTGDLVKKVLKGLGVAAPESLCDGLVMTARDRLRMPSVPVEQSRGG